MDKYVITGGKALCGCVDVQGSKNALLPVMAATVIQGAQYHLTNCPRIKDAGAMAEIIIRCGGAVIADGNDLYIDTRNLSDYAIPEEQTRAMRSSVFLLGPMLSRFGKVECAYPGGCAIGERPIDLHIKGFRELGVTVSECDGRIECSSAAAHAGRVKLDFPSVGATENLMMLAVSLEGTTVIDNAAREPEITELADFLRTMGVSVVGAGTKTVSVTGCADFCKEISYRIMPDRIVAGTLLCAAAATGGYIELRGAGAENCFAIIAKLREMNCKIEERCGIISLDARNMRLRCPASVETAPYPGFPTDMQAPMMALCAASEGSCLFRESMYENRFHHVHELMRMGADITACDREARVTGSHLTGAVVTAMDLRGGAALVSAGLAAEGVTEVRDVDSHIDRGYESLELTLRELGADIIRVKDE